MKAHAEAAFGDKARLQAMAGDAWQHVFGISFEPRPFADLIVGAALGHSDSSIALSFKLANVEFAAAKRVRSQICAA
jgi:hypothetical protein